jgi:hypothetical protein
MSLVPPSSDGPSAQDSSGDSPEWPRNPASYPDASLRGIFLEQLEILFGSADPDFDRYGDLLHQRYEEEMNAGNEEIADTLWKLHRVPLDVAYEASRRWDELEEGTKRSVLDFLAAYEQKLATTEAASKLREED